MFVVGQDVQDAVPDQPAQPSALQIVIVDTVAVVPEAAWDAVAGGEWSYAWRWQRLMEGQLRGYQPRYVLVYAGTELVAVAFCMTVPPYLLPKRFPRAIQPLVELVLCKTMLVCAAPLSARLEGLMIRPGWSDPQLIVAQVLRAMQRLSRRSFQLLHVFAATTAHDGPILRGLQQRGCEPVAVGPYVTLDVTWASFSEYLRALPRKRRTDIQRQLNNAERNGQIRIEALRPGEVTVPDAELYRLLANVAQRYGEDPQVAPGFFAALREELPTRSVLFIAWAGEQVAGFFTGLHDDHSIAFPLIGQDHALARQYGIYFLLHFAVIRYAIEHDLELINMGLTQLELKRRLGYQPNPRYFIVRSPYRPLDRAVQWALRRVAPRLIPALAQKPGA